MGGREGGGGGPLRGLDNNFLLREEKLFDLMLVALLVHASRGHHWSHAIGPPSRFT